jgi:hypothetical protein
VPFDKLWRTGASDCTTLTTDEDIVLGYYIKAGSYSLFTIPFSTGGLSLLIQILLSMVKVVMMKKGYFRFKVPVDHIQNFMKLYNRNKRHQ